MIKKTTIAVFRNGDYAGEYDWTGGIPLSVNEEITVLIGTDKKMKYKLVDKHTTLVDNADDQEVIINYFFEATL